MKRAERCERALAVERMARLDIDPGFRDVTPSRTTPSFPTLCLKGARVNELEGGREGGRKYVSWQVCLACAALARKGCGFENDVFSRGMVDFARG